MRVLPHEGAEAKALQRLPVCVERKLLESSARMSDEEFRGLPWLARQRLVAMRVDAAVERRAFRHLVRWLKVTFLGVAVAPELDARGLPPGDSDVVVMEMPPHPWRLATPPEAVPDAVWARSDPDARYALWRAEIGERPALVELLLRLAP